MKQLFIFTCIIFSFFNAAGQADTTTVFENDSTVKQPEFPGGLPGWRFYLERNLNVDLADSCIVIPKKRKSARQTVVVSFKVDAEGNVSEVKAENAGAVCRLLAAEAVRVIRNGPKWIPASRQNKPVKYMKKQPITWVLSED